MRKKLKLLNLKKHILISLTTLIFACSTEEVVLTDDTKPLPALYTSLSSALSSALTSCVQNAVGKKIYRFTELPGKANATDINKTTVFKTGDIDDRTCYADYHQKTITLANGSTKFVGVYKIAAGTQNQTGDPTQPRIERASKTVNTRKKGSFVQIEGFVTINDVGFVSDNYSNGDMRDDTGTYIVQAKGTHFNATIGSNDPAILLLIAKKRFENGSFKDYALYAEVITKRGGSGDNGRELVFIKNIPKNTRKKVVMKNYFKEDNQQWVKVIVDNKTKDFRIPNTKVTINGETKYQVGKQAKIRFGAYRCKGGQAEIYWDTMKQTYNEVL
ncbi:hypothetical protein [Algibacter sp. Ld11]|uniref:hypothetical protein n=1 Tax=Algibacter sp. Ld11 TaxID=649150 RepID=UPI0038648C50